MDRRRTACIEIEPSKSSIQFGDDYICLSAIARKSELDLSVISRIFSGDRNPSVLQAKKVAACLDMTLEKFIWLLDRRLETLAKTA